MNVTHQRMHFQYNNILVYNVNFKTLKNTPTCFDLNHLTPNGHYMGRTAQLTSRCCILYIYSTNILTEYFNHAA